MSGSGGGFRWSDCIAALVIIGCAAYLLLDFGGTTPRASANVPAMNVDRTPSGRLMTRINSEALRQFCEQVAHVPAPPEFNGSDPEPVQVYMSLLEEWTQTRSGDALGAMGQVCMALEQPNIALDYFVAAAALGQQQALWTYLAGVQCQSLGMAQQAIDLLTEAAKLDPTYAPTYARLGLLHLERGELDQAERSYEKYRELSPRVGLGSVGLGRIALAQGHADTALKHLTEAVRASPGDFMAHRLLSQALARAGRDQEALLAAATSERLPKYRGWLTFDERVHDAHKLARTQRYFENELRSAAAAGNVTAATEAAQALLERRPDDADMMVTMATLLHRQGAIDKAEAMIDRAIDVDGESITPLRVRAEMAFVRKDYKTAMNAATAILQVDPRFARAKEILGRIQFLSNNEDEGIELMQEAVSLDPASIETRKALVAMLRQAGRAEESQGELETLAKLAPDDAWVQQQLQAPATQPSPE